MRRLSLKFLVKSFLVVMGIMFLLPIIMQQIDSQEEDKALENERRNIIKKDLGQKHNEEPLQEKLLKVNALDRVQKAVMPSFDSDKGVHLAPVPVGNQPEEKGHADNLQTGAIPGKVFGPKAEFKDGVNGNYEPQIIPKSGPGEGGEAVYVGVQDKQAADRSVREFGFNMVASDQIAMDRNIPDTRHSECQYWHYPEQLPTASVIVVFHNEGWSTLMRTVHSIINTSPPHLLREVVMVDDFSDKEFLKGKLDDYVKQFNGKVNVYRNPERLGLIRTRSLGAKYAKGDVIVFLDAHCECNRNWLPPLLARIAYDRTVMAVPYVDSINWGTFAYRPVYQPGTLHRGIFEWGFLYKESSVPQKELSRRQYSSEPHWAPTHAGGLYAMDRNYFHELGAYDEGLQIWGGENFELSFKIWLCGGSIEWVPCSRVGHVYRNHMPYGFGNINPKIPVIQLNYMRVVEVWLDDEFKEYFYTREPSIKGYPIGNITHQVNFRKQNCPHSFKWFMDNIAYEVYDKFPPPPPNQAWGEIRDLHGSNCWDGLGVDKPVGMYGCHHYGGNQLFRLNTKGQLGLGERCLDVKGGAISVIYCPVQPTGPWTWDESTGLIKHSGTRKCAQGKAAEHKLTLTECNEHDDTQKWTIKPIWSWK